LNVGLGIPFWGCACGAPNPFIAGAGAAALAPKLIAGPVDNEDEKSNPEAGLAGGANIFSAGLAAPNMLLLVVAAGAPNTLPLVVAPNTDPFEGGALAPNENPVLADVAAGAAAAPKLNPPVAGFAGAAPNMEAGC